MKRNLFYLLFAAIAALGAYPILKSTPGCLAYTLEGFRRPATDRSKRFLAKVQADTARCRGGDDAVAWRETPWIDWQKYWAAGGPESLVAGIAGHLGFLGPNRRGINGALLDLEYQRIELLKFNLFDNSGTYEEYVRNQSSPIGKLSKIWPQFRLPKDQWRQPTKMFRRIDPVSHPHRYLQRHQKPAHGLYGPTFRPQRRI